LNPALQLGIIFAMAIAHSGAQGTVTKSSDHQREVALALEQQGKYAEAETAWRADLKAHPSWPEPYAHLGLLEAQQEHYKEAVPLYRKALAMNPNVPSLRLNLGLALFKGGELKGALHEFAILLKSAAPDSPEAQRLTILTGMAHYGLTDYAEAVPLLKQAAARDQQNLPLRLALAHSCLWSKQLQCVLDVYHEILTLNSESAEADMLAGEALDEMKDSTGATKMFRAAVQANPKEPNVHFGLGYLLWTQKIYPEAAKEFQAELANDPDHAQSMLYLADANLQMNQPEVALPLLQKVVKLDPSQSLAHLDLGIIYSDSGKNDDAMRELTLAAKLKPNEVNVHWRLGRLYRTLGKKDDAKIEFDKASSLNKAVNEDLLKKMSDTHTRANETKVQQADPANPKTP
jgi:tetratricopeptide (TPR) repeat protein